MGTPRGIVTEERAKAAKIKDRFAREAERIESQRNLTVAGKRSRLARAAVKAQDELAQLQADEAKRVAERRDQLHKDLFGAFRPDDSRIISIRDAADRASRVTDANEAADLMNRAELNGDHVLLKAVAAECAQRSNNPLESGWRKLFDQWAGQQTHGSDIVEELNVIGDEMTDAGHRLSRDHAFSLGALPEDLRGLGNLRALASHADDDGVMPPTRGQQAGAALLNGMGAGTE